MRHPDRRTLAKLPQRLLSAGSLVLDTDARLLSGPAGSVKIGCGTFVVVSELLRHAGTTLDMMQLSTAIWRGAVTDPAGAIFGVRVRVCRARRLLDAVGVDGHVIRSVRGVGYCIDIDPRVVRSTSPEAARAMDALFTAHPELLPSVTAAMARC